MTKQEAIKNAWAKLPKCEVDENGWTKRTVPYENFDLSDYDTQQYMEGSYIRPKSLKGIENNNGWIKIESDGSNLPKEKGSYFCVSDSEQKLYYFNGEKFLNIIFKEVNPSHYRIYSPPIY